MVDMKEIEQLAKVLYDEITLVWRQKLHLSTETIVPFAEQDEATKTAFIRGAVAANTTMINMMARRK